MRNVSNVANMKAKKMKYSENGVVMKEKPVNDGS